MNTFPAVPDDPRPPNHLLRLKNAEEQLQPYKSLLDECIQHGWDAWSKDYAHKHHLLSARARAAIVFDEIVAYAEQKFSGLDGVTLRRRSNSFLLFIGNVIIIRFKKIGKNGRCSSIATHQQVLFALQAELPGMEKGTMLHAGYALDDLQRAIIRKLIVCQFANRVMWTISLSEAAATIISMPSTAAPEQPNKPRWESKKIEENKAKKKSKGGE